MRLFIIPLLTYALVICAAKAPAHEQTAGQAQEKHLKTVLKSITRKQFEKAFKFYAALENWDDQFSAITAILKFAPRELSEKELKAFEDIIKAFRPKYDQAAFDAAVSPAWKKVLTRVYIPQVPIPLDADVKEKEAKADVKPTHAEARDLEQQMVDLVSSEGDKIAVSRALAQNKWISLLLANALEHDSDAQEIPIAGVSTQVLKTVVYCMNRLYEAINRLENEEKQKLSEQRDIVWSDINRLSHDIPIGEHETSFDTLPALIKAANYLDVPVLFNEFINRYIKKLYHRFGQGDDGIKFLVNELQKSNFTKDVLGAISWMYLQRFGIDLDRALGLQRIIPFRSGRFLGIETLLRRAFSDDEIDQIEKHPNVSIDGMTALNSTLMLGEFAAFCALLKHSGIDVNVQGRDGVTPLWMAVEYNNIRGVRELLARGADPEYRDILERAAVQRSEILQLIVDGIARKKDPKAMAAYLQHSRALSSALLDGYYRNAQILISAGADIDLLAELGRSIPYRKDPDQKVAYQALIDIARKRGLAAIAEHLEYLRDALGPRATPSVLPLVG